MKLVLLLCLLITINCYAQKAAIFQSGTVKILKDTLKFKDSNVLIITNDSDDPTVVAKDAPIGSFYIKEDDGVWYRKLDNGSSTNWTLIVSSGIQPSIQDLDADTFVDTEPSPDSDTIDIRAANTPVMLLSSADAVHYLDSDFTGGLKINGTPVFGYVDSQDAAVQANIEPTASALDATIQANIEPTASALDGTIQTNAEATAAALDANVASTAAADASTKADTAEANAVGTANAYTDSQIGSTLADAEATAQAHDSTIQSYIQPTAAAEAASVQAYISPTASALDSAIDIGDLADVDLVTATPADGEGLCYDQAGDDWIPCVVGGASGISGGTDGHLPIFAGATTIDNGGFSSSTGVVQLTSGVASVSSGLGTFASTSAIGLSASGGGLVKGPTIVVDEITWVRIGAAMIVFGTYIQTTTGGTGGSGTYLVLVPNSQSIDTSVVNASTSLNEATVVGVGAWNNAANMNNRMTVHVYDSTHIYFRRNDSGSTITNTQGVGYADWRLTFAAILPISGW